jgi:solute carrier family 25 folate transporter 32
MQGFYRGVTPNCIGAGVAWGLYFLFYNTIKTQILQADPREVLGPLDHIKAAAEAGVLCLIFTNPLWVVKTRLCLQYNTTNDAFHLPPSKRYFGMFDTFRKVYRYEGFSGFYKGFVPGLFGVSHGAIQFMAYEELKKYYIQYYSLDPAVKFNTAELLMFAIVSKICAATLTFPSQVVRARMQDQHNVYKGFIDTVSKTWRYVLISLQFRIFVLQIDCF